MKCGQNASLHFVAVNCKSLLVYFVILESVITRTGELLVNNIVVSGIGISDHLVMRCNFLPGGHRPTATLVTSRSVLADSYDD